DDATPVGPPRHIHRPGHAVGLPRHAGESLMLRRRSRRDFESEIRSHIELEAERLRAQGVAPDEADRIARLNFGNVGVAEDRFYHGQRFSSVQDALRDVRHAWRSLLRTPGFLVISVATLALAIGATTGMF